MYDEVHNTSDEIITFLHAGTESQQLSRIHGSHILPLSSLADFDVEILCNQTSANEDDDQFKITRAKDTRRRRMYRWILRSEREELRQQVAHLNGELSRIRHIKEMEKAKFDAEQKPEFWFWKSTAAQQHHQRRLVEREHEALKRAVDIQTTYIKTLEVVRQEVGGSLVDPINLPGDNFSEDIETTVFEEFIQEVDVDFSNDQDPLLDVSY
ncbi:hypothetical protein PHMEG_00029501 [Phytophthora megakarya]|uniref:Uncharacterized protein n=1 Tax=Phytophthora megakarya TaxID=4795 RepID=A0A225V3G2_9STRA|nr:hypothetical protein PHMEG_00029501 [Phytophthora megakarya]